MQHARRHVATARSGGVRVRSLRSAAAFGTYRAWTRCSCIEAAGSAGRSGLHTASSSGVDRESPCAIDPAVEAWSWRQANGVLWTACAGVCCWRCIERATSSCRSHGVKLRTPGGVLLQWSRSRRAARGTPERAVIDSDPAGPTHGRRSAGGLAHRTEVGHARWAMKPGTYTARVAASILLELAPRQFEGAIDRISAGRRWRARPTCDDQSDS